MIRRKLEQVLPFLKSKVAKPMAHKSTEMEELEMSSGGRYKPEGLDELCKSTNFSKKELQIMYRGFKQECPSGIVNEDTFKAVFAQFFPQGDSRRYAHYVFSSFDQDANGTISFQEFVMGLSLLARGSLREKLEWAFTLYDFNRDGIITREEMLCVISSIYHMMGRFSEPAVDEHTALDHVDLVFRKMDRNHDGVITMQEFMDTCLQDENIVKAIMMFDTVI